MQHKRTLGRGWREVLVLLLLLLPTPLRAAERDPGEGIPWWTVETGGGGSSGGSYSLRGTMGQSEVSADPLSGDSFRLRGGFWYPRIDRDSDGIPDIEETVEDIDGDGKPNYADDESDDDDVSDSIEHKAPNSGDGNGDGVADWKQPNVTSLPDVNGHSYLTLAAPEGTKLKGAQAITPTVAPPDVISLPQGMLKFEVPRVQVGGTQVLTLTVHNGTPNGYWKYGPTPNNPDDHWYSFLWDGETGARIEGNQILLTFVDGKRGDGDLMANGSILDPGGPSLQSRWDVWLPQIRLGPRLVYSNDYSQGSGNVPQVTLSTSPSGERFLGEFGNEHVKLSLPNLPPHHKVTVRFDLYLIRSWDGNQVEVPPTAQLRSWIELNAIDGKVGPDRWIFKADGQILMDTNFANIPDFHQSYPDGFGAGSHQAGTGAKALNTLGYRFADGPMDAIYTIERSFAHNASSLSLDFAAIGLQILEDESWGIDNLTVIVE